MIVGVPLMANQPITLIGQGDHHHNFVSEADVAAFAIAAVDNPHAANQRIGVGGPASYTWTGIVDAVGRSMSTQLPMQYLPAGSELPLLPPVVSELMNGMETSETFIDMTESAPAYGVTLTTLHEYVQRTFVEK
jgi:nucleoside-diphosphate-sugar epimerase